MTDPLVTAIVPTYRRPELLGKSLGSIFRQTYRPLELVVVDDGSGDNTQEVLAGFEDKARLEGVEYRYYEKENAGPGPAKNFAMQRAKGEYLAFLDDDDRWYPQKLETQMNVMRSHPEAGASFTQYVFEGKEAKPRPYTTRMKDGWVFETLCTGETRAHMQTLLVRHADAEKAGGFGHDRHWDDTEFELRLSLETPFVAVLEPLTVICTVESSISREEGLEGDLVRDNDKFRLLSRLEERYADHPRFSTEAANIMRARLFDEHVKHLVWLGRVKEAREALQRGINECGDLPRFQRLKRKLARARVAGWFGRTLKKP